LFGDDPKLHYLRKAYAMKEGTVLEADNRTALTAFIWWSSWSAVTNRPGKHISYTNNGRTIRSSATHPLASAAVERVQHVVPDRGHRSAWLASCEAARGGSAGTAGQRPARDDSRDAVDARNREILLVVIALFLTQILLGAITAHYQVEGQEAYGFALSNSCPTR
jgi:nitric oxide reductase subunit B